MRAVKDTILLASCVIFLIFNESEKQNYNEKIDELNKKIASLQTRQELIINEKNMYQEEVRELSEYKKIFDDEFQEKYDKSDLKIMMTNKDGEISYHFVYLVEDNLDTKTPNLAYNSYFREITHPENIYPNKKYKIYRPNLEEYLIYDSFPQFATKRYLNFVPDYKITNALLDISSVIPIKYSNKNTFTKSEIEEIEEVINNEEKVNWLEIKEKEYLKENLVVISNGESSFICDLSNNTRFLSSKYDWDIDTLQMYDYCYRITDPSEGIKINLGVNYITWYEKEKKEEEIMFNPYITEVVSLDELEAYQNTNFMVLSLNEYLSDEEKQKESFTYTEIETIENEINKSLKKEIKR